MVGYANISDPVFLAQADHDFGNARKDVQVLCRVEEWDRVDSREKLMEPLNLGLKFSLQIRKPDLAGHVTTQKRAPVAVQANTTIPEIWQGVGDRGMRGSQRVPLDNSKVQANLKARGLRGEFHGFIRGGRVDQQSRRRDDSGPVSLDDSPVDQGREPEIIGGDNEAAAPRHFILFIHESHRHESHR